MSTPLTGDIKNRVEVAKSGVTLHNFPQVTTAELAALAGTINDKAVSGKRLGAQVVVVNSIATPTTAAIYVASGSDSNSGWVPSVTLLGAAQTATVVPA